MGTLIRAVLVGAGLLAASWAGMAFAAKRLPPGAAKDLASVLPACLIATRRLRADPRVPRRAKVAVAFAGLWVLSPVDLIPEFLPIIGPLDDVIVVALALFWVFELLVYVPLRLGAVFQERVLHRTAKRVNAPSLDALRST